MEPHPRLVALLGNPVRHSLSPRIQNAAFRASGVAGTYLALRTTEEDLPGLLGGIARSGGCGNVTLPHKESAARVVDRRTPAADRTGAVNTFWLADGRVHGDNTDVIGVRRALDALLTDHPAGLRDRHVLLIGAGGAARAVLAALEQAGVGSVRIRNRTAARARALVDEMAPFPMPVQVEDPDGLPSHPHDASRGAPLSLVINATRLGLDEDDALPLPVDELPSGAAVLDLVYRPGETRWVRGARAAGHPAADGGWMLVEQGMAAFERWWGIPAPRDVFLRELAAIRAEADRP
ncbi:MAG: shikimate dehydrogenase [Gemmatimonadales bacterium]|nr:MAG: shikimate dehydrogenase [Gemmatimonadales bacterium]